MAESRLADQQLVRDVNNTETRRNALWRIAATPKVSRRLIFLFLERFGGLRLAGGRFWALVYIPSAPFGSVPACPIRRINESLKQFTGSFIPLILSLR